MTIAKLINEYGEKHSPYMRGLINHLPMAQLALYKMTGDLERVKEFTIDGVNRFKFIPVLEEYPKCESIVNCIGKKDMYESFLDQLRIELKETNVKGYVSDILNTYSLGISSGLFHTVTRLYYAMEGYALDKDLIEEVRRATSYYITAYTQADIFKRKIRGEDIIEEMEKLIQNQSIRDSIPNEYTTIQKIETLYNNVEYMEAGFVISGNEDEKVEALLNMLLLMFVNSGNIMVLHCITGLQALLGLKEYYDDFDKALDILTTAIITHLMTTGKLNLNSKKRDRLEFSWNYILSLGSESQNFHSIKFTYSTYEISKKYPVKNLKRAALKRIDIK